MSYRGLVLLSLWLGVQGALGDFRTNSKQHPLSAPTRKKRATKGTNSLDLLQRASLAKKRPKSKKRRLLVTAKGSSQAKKARAGKRAKVGRRTKNRKGTRRRGKKGRASGKKGRRSRRKSRYSRRKVRPSGHKVRSRDKRGRLLRRKGRPSGRRGRPSGRKDCHSGRKGRRARPKGRPKGRPSGRRGRRRSSRRKRRRWLRLPRRYRLRWGRRCPRFGLSRRVCYRVWRRRKAAEVHQLVGKLLSWWERELRQTPKEVLAKLARSREKGFSVSRWWWDRYKSDRQYQVLDGIDRLLQRVLLRYPLSSYKETMNRLIAFLGHRALSLPRETALVSRLTRLLVRRPHPSLINRASEKMIRLMTTRSECTWWYINFLGTFRPRQLRAFVPHIDPKRCKMRQWFLQTGFLSSRQIVRSMRKLIRRRRSFARLHRIGYSAEGRKIWALQIGPGVRKKRARASLLLVGNQHADEHAGADILLALARYLLRRVYWKKSPVYRWVRDRDIWIVPVANPDGKHFDRLGGIYKYWRFNRGIMADGQLGVDLNRNYSYGWKKWTYYGRGRINLPGPAPFSEPETRVLRDLARRLPRLTTIVDVHQYGGMLLTPYACRTSPLPGQQQRLFDLIGQRATARNRYRVRPAHSLYPHHGTLGDWGFVRFKAVSLVLELGHKLYLTSAQVRRLFRQNRYLLLQLIELADNPRRILSSPNPSAN